MRRSSVINEEQYQNDLKVVTETFTDAEFSIGEGYFYETSGTFGEDPSEGFEFITIKDYGDKYYDDLVRENLENFEGLSSIFDYDDIKKELDVNEIKHYTMYVEDGIFCQKKGQSSFVNWEQRDSDCLTMCEKAIEEIMGYNGKPIRICKSAIRRNLGLNNTWFNNQRLVKTHKYIAKAEEDITSYRVRKIRWAISKMLENEQSITPYKVQLYAGFGGGKTDVRILIEKEIDNIE